MKPDLYTKTVLTIIALLLASNLLINGHVPAVQAQQPSKIVAVPYNQYTSTYNPLGVCGTNNPSACYILQFENHVK
jgi:hypothetical protein